MSTNDVPGAKTGNADVLAMGCWAEHEDGSMIFVESVEAGRVIYSMFDLAHGPLEYRDAMPESGFKKQFSYDPKAKKPALTSIKWTWHDKTPFPWDRVMDSFPAGPRRPSAAHEMTAAERVGESLNIRAKEIREEEVAHMRPQRSARGVMQRIQDAIHELTR